MTNPSETTLTGTTALTVAPIAVGHVVRDANGVFGQVLQDDAWFCGEPAVCVKTQNGEFLLYHRDALEIIGLMEEKPS